MFYSSFKRFSWLPLVVCKSDAVSNCCRPRFEEKIRGDELRNPTRKVIVNCAGENLEEMRINNDKVDNCKIHKHIIRIST